MEVLEKVTCYHCGDLCGKEIFKAADKNFCCYGCKVVFELLNDNNLCEYYKIEDHPGIKPSSVDEDSYSYLDNKEIRKKILEFDSSDFSRVRFTVPGIHCSSCIWLLENMDKVAPGVIKSEVNFSKKQVCVDFNPDSIELSRIAAILSTLGYAPTISHEASNQKEANSGLLLRVGVAGFVFGNVMLFSFPEYLGLDASDHTLGRLFSFLNLALSIPVMVYSASGYFTSAFKSFSQKQINIDVPIALGLLALFSRSTYDIITATGPGYLDSFTGLVFFLLIGRWFQGKTYESLSFERDFKSYFPLAVQKLADGAWLSTVIFELKKSDVIKIRNFEIVPTDSTLLDATAFIDYSFVTGESRPIKAFAGDFIYAGGRLIGQPVTLSVEQPTSQSHLTSLWNNAAFRKKYESQYKKIIDNAARKFTWVVLAIAAITAGYWYLTQPSEMWLVLTSVLMVACPCALALAAPFTYGSMLRVFGRNGFYLKNSDVIERMASINAIVFDKTGTVTHGSKPQIEFVGDLNSFDRAVVKTLTGFSTHPLSVLVNASIAPDVSVYVSDFIEKPGKGIQGSINSIIYRIGSAKFAGATEKISTDASVVYVSVGGEVRGYYRIQANVRENVGLMLYRLGKRCFAMLSGDTASDERQMKDVFPHYVALKFNQSAGDKLDFIAKAQAGGKRLMMIGDGLNDAGALKQADVGIAVTDDTGLFTPACDGILQGNQVANLDKFMSLARSSSRVLKIAFGISFLYNAIALTFAVSGHLTPIVAAILMPASSISVVGFSTIAVNLIAKTRLKK